MASQEAILPFDILSYPRDAVEELILVDVGQPMAGNDQVPDITPAAETGIQYVDVARSVGALPGRTMLVSDRPENAREALSSGMGVTIVDDFGGLAMALNVLRDPTSQTDQPLYERPLYTDLSYEEIAEAFYTPDKISIVGVVGRTGAGKTTSIDRVVDALHRVGGHGAKFEVDGFFIRSRKERRAWLNESGISDEERADRRRVVTWWDLGRAASVLGQIRDGEHVQLDGLYDMRRGGEMVGAMDIDPGDKGYTVFVEGTALLVPEFASAMDAVVYMNTHDQARADFLMERNLRDGYTAEESRARKVLTDAAETGEHIARHLRVIPFHRSSLTVLDNTHRGDTLRLMPPFIPEK